jgi:hypothetical protein
VTRSAPPFARFVPSLLALTVVVGLAGLRLAGAYSVYDGLLTLWGIVPFDVPFLDIDGPLSSMECARQGFDVIAWNPCDLEYRPYNYSPLLLTLDWIPLGSGDRVWVGLAMDTAFLLSLAVLPPPTSWRETALRCAAILSTMVVFGVERANVDVLVFTLVVAMLVLLSRSLPFRMLGFGLGFLAGAIKYYPFILLSLVAKERLRTGVAIGFALFMAILLFLHAYTEPLARTLLLIPFNTAFTDMFGAMNVLEGGFELFRERIPDPGDAAAYALAVTAVLAVAVAAVIAGIWGFADLGASLFRLDELSRLALVAGATLLVVCFFIGQNVGYRGIFLLLLLPGLSALGRDRASGALAPAARLSVVAIPPLMWAEAIRLWLHLAATGQYPPPSFAMMHVLVEPVDLAAWAVREILWWLLIGFLGLLLFGFAATIAGERWRDLQALVRGRAV